MKDKDVVSIIEAFDILEGTNSMDDIQTPSTICERIINIRNKYDIHRGSLGSPFFIRRPTCYSGRLHRALESLYCRLDDKFLKEGK